MYFTNISNPELDSYHGKTKTNNMILLSEVLSDSDSIGFKVETIISDKLYKIYPMFYCDEILSTNPNDQVFDNKLVICEKKTDTILEFKKNEVGG